MPSRLAKDQAFSRVDKGAAGGALRPRAKRDLRTSTGDAATAARLVAKSARAAASSPMTRGRVLQGQQIGARERLRWLAQELR